MSPIKNYFQFLDQRRRELGMSHADLARRSGVSVPTVTRILSAMDPAASFSNVHAVAAALGVRVDLTPQSEPEEFRQQQAQEKARRLVSLVQGNSGLEGQAVDDATVNRMINRTVVELLAGPGRRLWGDQ